MGTLGPALQSRIKSPHLRRACFLLLFVGAAILVAAIAAPVQSEQKPPEPKISSQVKLVYVSAIVRDSHGKIVPTLNKDDFTLDEDGRSQSISNFLRESDLPLTLGLLVDTSYSQRYVLNDERDASYKFLDEMLRDKDKAFVIHFDREVELLQDLTSDRAKLKSALALLEISDPRRGDDNSDDDGEAREHRGGTQLYDAIFLASNELMKKQQGRKALFILSDGVDRNSKESLEDAIESAQRADVSVYSLLFASREDEEHRNGGGHHGGWGGVGGPGVGWPGPGGGYPGGGGGGGGGQGGGRRQPQERHEDGKKVLDQISKETGGRLFEIAKKLTVADAYAQSAEELRNQYILGYTPAPSDSGPGYHKIHLGAKQAGLSVQARDGYYSDK